MRKTTLCLMLAAVCSTGLWVACTPTQKQLPTVSLNCYGKDTEVRFDTTGMTRLQALDSASIAECKAWLQQATTQTVEDLRALQQELRLADWALMKQIEQLSAKALGSNNEAQLMTHVIMEKLGYRSALGCDSTGEQLYQLFATKGMVYNHSYFAYDSLKWFVSEPNTVNVANILGEFPKEGKLLSVAINVMPNLPYTPSEPRTIKARDFEDFAFTVSINKNLMAYYDDYMHKSDNEGLIAKLASKCEAPLDPRLQQELIDPMKEKLKDKSKLQALSMLLNWVQTGLEYAYDEDVWGYDRDFFAEETLFYPSCDTEDRSILLAQLVHHVLGLPVAFIFYYDRGHTALGVEVGEDAKGASVDVDGKKFLICDPTYIGSWPGQEIPQMEKEEKQVRLLYND